MKVAKGRSATGRRGRGRGPAKDRSGVGSVEVLPSGRFRPRVWVGGERKGDTFASRDDAERQRASLAVMHRAVVEGLPPEPDALTLGAWARTWLGEREEKGQARNAPRDRTRWGQYLTGSALDGMALEEIRGKHVNAWVDAMVKRPRAKGPGRLSAQTIRHAFNLLRLCLADAKRAEHLDANPCDGVRLPKLRAPEGTFLTVRELRALADGSPGVPEESQRAFTVATFTGLREGELIALRWADVTLEGDRPEVHVQRSHDGPPKNGKTRRVPLFPQAVEALKRQLRHATSEGDGVEPDDLVFPSARGFQRQPSDDFGWSSRKRRQGAPTGYKAALGITRPVRFHDLRHTCASHLAMGTWTSAPWPIQDIAAFMGHSSLAMAQRYMHLAPAHLHDRVRGAGGGTSGTGRDPSPGVTPGADAGRGMDAPRGTEVVVPRSRENTVCPARLERATGGLEGRDASLETQGVSLAVGHPWDATRVAGGLAMELLRAVDAGTPAGALARSLALDVLRSAPADSAPWARAVAVLEGGPLRMRHAVELAGLVVDATEHGVTGEEMTG